MDKILRVYACRGTGMGAEYLDLPATPYALLDAADRARPEEGETARFFVEEVRGFRFLSGHLAGGYDLPALNALAEKLAELDEGQATALAGLVQMDEAGRADAISLPRLIDLAYSTDCCHVVDEVRSDAELGRLCAENGFCPELDGLPDAVFALLDFARIGREHRQSEGGVFVECRDELCGGYVERHGEPAQVYETLEPALKTPDYAILLELENGERLKLPTAAGTLPHCGFRCLDCRVPALTDVISDSGADLQTVNAFARTLARLGPEQITACKALVEAKNCRSLREVELLADSLDRYFFVPELATPEQVARDELSTLLDDRAAALLLPHLDLERYGQALIKHCGGVLTGYGLIERADGHPVRTETLREQEKGMGMSGYG